MREPRIVRVHLIDGSSWAVELEETNPAQVPNAIKRIGKEGAFTATEAQGGQNFIPPHAIVRIAISDTRA